MNTEFQGAGVHALVVLHERHLREFLGVWRTFHASQAALPETSDESYASNEALLRHVLGAARHYVHWCCEQLQYPSPDMRVTPGEDEIEAQAAEYTEHSLERWQVALVDLRDEDADDGSFESSWGAPFTIDSMLEHAVMHPIRHTYQLQGLLAR